MINDVIEIDDYTINFDFRGVSVSIYDEMLFHASMTKELTKEELLEQLDFYLKLVEKK